MGQRIRALVLLVVLLVAGTLLGSSLAQWWHVGPPPPGLESSRVRGRVRVEVLNAGGTSGVARGATAVLRDLGLDVVYYGNAENFSDEPSVVLDRVGRVDAARTVADALGIRELRSEPDSNLFVDVTVRLGPEWSGVPDSLGNDSASRPWWDLRRFAPRKKTTENPDSTGS